MAAILNRTKDNPWPLKTPPGTSEYMEALGLCELEHQPKNNRMRAKQLGDHRGGVE